MLLPLLSIPEKHTYPHLIEASLSYSKVGSMPFDNGVVDR
jgi:hypothetical protein